MGKLYFDGKYFGDTTDSTPIITTSLSSKANKDVSFNDESVTFTANMKMTRKMYNKITGLNISRLQWIIKKIKTAVSK